MGVAFILLLGISIFNSESYQEFSENSNGNPAYAISVVGECRSGLRESGYAWAPVGSVVLKQLNHDGTVGETCLKG